MAWVTLMYHNYLWLVDTHGEDGNVLTRRCLGNTSVTQVKCSIFLTWVVFIRVCSLCNNSLSCSVHHNLITIKKKKEQNFR